MQEYRRDGCPGDAAEPTGPLGIGTEYPSISGLSSAARGILLGYLLMGVSIQPMKEMEWIGIKKKETYLVARKELEEAGYITINRRPGKSPLISLHPSLHRLNDQLTVSNHEVIPSNLSNIYINKYDGTSQTELMDIPTSSGGGIAHLGSPQSRVHPKNGYSLETGIPLLPDDPLVPCTPHLADDPKVLPTLLARCEEVDGMDGSGEERSRTSPFQTRRREQLGMMDELIEKFLPGVEIGNADRKRLLGWCDNSLETLYEELEYVASAIQKKGGIDYPRGYALKTIEARSKTRVLSSSARPVQPIVQYGAAAYREGEPLPDPEPEWLAESLEKGRLAMERYITERGLLE